jgi:hypothetical protein
MYDKLAAKRVAVDPQVKDDFSLNMYKMSYDYPDGGQNLFLLQTPKILNDQGGIPKIDQFHENNKSRCYFNIPFNPDNKDAVTFMNNLQALDKIFSSKEFRKKIFGAEGVDDHEYSSIVRVKREAKPKKGEEKKESKPRHPYMKVKLACAYTKREKGVRKSKEEEAADKEADGNPRILTKLFLRNEKPKGDQKKREEQKIEFVDDIAKHFRWMCNYRTILYAPHVWELKSTDKYGKYGYGVTFKARLIEVMPGTNTYAPINEDCIVSEDDEADVGINSESESEENNKKKTAAPKTATKGKTPVADDDDTDEKLADSDEGSDAEEDEIPKGKGKAAPAKKAPPAKGKKKQESESEEDEESDAEESGSESESEDEAPPPKKGGRKAPAPPAKGGRKGR